jgi:glycosyltransferase involved in cell wall biosynthesis
VRVVYFYPWGSFYPVRSGSARVVCNHLDYFHSRGWKVDCVVALEAAGRGEMLQSLREKYSWLHSVHFVDAPRSSWTFRETILFYDESKAAQDLCGTLTAGADLFFANYVFTTPLLRQVSSSCLQVLEAVDILTPMFTNIGRQLGVAPANSNSAIGAVKDKRHLEIEMDLYRLYDAVIMINENELQTALSFGLDNVHYVPQMFPVAHFFDQSIKGPVTFDLAFVGSDNVFNVRGITWFYRNVYVPYLWKHGVRLALVGKVSERVDWEDARVVKMVVDDSGLKHIYQSTKVVIAPIFHGTGTAMKTLEGMANGGVMVATHIAARGITANDKALVRFDMKADPEATANRILELLRSDCMREQLRDAALEFMQREHSRDVYFAAMDRVIASATCHRGRGDLTVRYKLSPAA